MLDVLFVLTRLLAFGFVLLGLVTLTSWIRYRGRSRAFLAGAFSLLGLVALLDQVNGLVAHTLAAEVISTMAFLGSGGALLGFRCCFIPLSKRAKVGAGALLGLAVVVGVGLAAAAPVAMALKVAGTALVVLAWCACVAEPALRFWRAARGRPAVQRARLRALAAGFMGIVVILVIALSAGSYSMLANTVPPLPASLVVQLTGLVIIPLLYVSFAPPRWVRHLWRRREEESFRRATQDLVRFSSDRASLSQRALAGAVQLVGAESGVIAGPAGKAVATIGLEDSAAAALAGEAARHCADGSGIGLVGRPAERLLVPLETESGTWALLLVAGPFTPLFGSDELRTLQEFAGLVVTALERVELAEKLSWQTTHGESLLQAISDMGEGVHISHNGRLLYGNAAFVALTGYSLPELRRMESLSEMAPPELRNDLHAQFEHRVHGDAAPYHYETQLVHKDGRRIDIEVVINMLGDVQEGRMMTIVRDISERKAAHRALAGLTLVDPLTQVANRRGWSDALPEALTRARRSGEPLSVAMLDLDSFKAFNDDWGHIRGDRLLVNVADAWRGALREVDLIARYGGDEFAVMLPGCDTAGAVEALDRLRPVTPEQQPVSIGVATWDRVESEIDLLDRADAALFLAKRAGGAKTVVASTGRTWGGSNSWSTRIETLLSRRDLEAVYQPIVRLSDQALIGYEALARPTGTGADASVEDLFAAAQRLGFGRDLDWLGRRAAVQGAADLPPGALLFVNVGVWALLDPLHDVDQMELLLEWAGRSPAEIVLEVSEREVIKDLGRLSDVLAGYRGAGFRFALDDVGDGHCTLEVLSAANAEFIKIARSLTTRADEPGPGSAIRALVTFARSNGAEVVAEGIESRAMMASMLVLGIHLGQGFHLGRPGTIEAEVDRSRIAATGRRRG